MERNFGPDQIPDDAAPKSAIPTIHISSAMKVIANDLGGEQLLRTVSTLIETSDPEFPSVAAISLLAEEHPNSVEYILTLAEEMHADDRRWRRSRRFARREERPQWRRDLGKGILNSMQFSIFGGGMIIPPHLFE